MLNNSGVNKVILVGQVAKQPRRHSFNGVQFLCFPLITQEFIKKNGQRIEHLEFHQIKLPIESLEEDFQFNKGDQVYIQGKIQTQQFVDEQNVKRYKTDIIANFIQPLGLGSLDAQALALSKAS